MNGIPDFTADQALFLQSRLGVPGRPEGAMTYPHAAGFLFTVACSPELIRPSEWLPCLFGDEGTTTSEMGELQEFLPAIFSLYNWINDGVRAGEPTLPFGIAQSPDPMGDLSPRSTLSEWSQGFIDGHEWAEMSEWMEQAPEKMDRQLGALTLCLSFWASRKLAEAYIEEMGTPGVSFEGVARGMAEAFTDSMKHYALFGNDLKEILEKLPEEPPSAAVPHPQRTLPLREREEVQAVLRALRSSGTGLLLTSANACKILDSVLT